MSFREDLRPAEFNRDFGEPACSCVEEAPGLFVRQWTRARVSVDCTTLTGSIDMLE